MAAPPTAPICCHFKMGSSWCNSLFPTSAAFFSVPLHLLNLSVLVLYVLYTNTPALCKRVFKCHVKSPFLLMLELFTLVLENDPCVLWIDFSGATSSFFCNVLMSLNVIIVQRKISNVVIATHWVHLSRTSIIGFKFCAIMHVMCSVLCGSVAWLSSVSYFKQVVRHVFFMLLLMQSCHNAAKTAGNGNAWGKKVMKHKNTPVPVWHLHI